jgi:hypothetical protein
MIGEAFSLTAASLDILWEDLKLGNLPLPLAVQSVGETYEDRRRIRDQVWRDLTERGLAHRGKLDAELHEALSVLVHFDTAISLFGVLDGSTEVRARASGNTRFAVVVRQVKDGFRLQPVEATKLVWSILDVLPDERPFPGRPITLRETAADRSGYLQPARNVARDSDEAKRMFTTPRIRAGFFTVYGQGDHGRDVSSPQLAWVDTEQGRFLSVAKTTSVGKSTLHAPAGKQELAAQLRELVAWVHLDD